MTQIIESAKTEFFKVIDNFGSDPYNLKVHLTEMEKWAHLMLKKHPEADKEIVLLSVWLHDIGHYPAPAEIDHAVRSEERAKIFLEKHNYSENKLTKVLHCVRAHRCSDVLPESIEAKIIAFIDSASHMTCPIYFDMARDAKVNNHEMKVYSKIDRDFRDLKFFPEMQEEMKELCDAWRNLIKEYDQLNVR